MNTTNPSRSAKTSAPKWTSSARPGLKLSTSAESRKARALDAFKALGLGDKAGAFDLVSSSKSTLPDSASELINFETGLRVLVSYETIVAIGSGERRYAAPRNLHSCTTDKTVKAWAGRGVSYAGSLEGFETGVKIALAEV